MKIAFTICSNNYLSQAKALGDSLMQHNPDYKFIIGLCDKKNALIDYSFFESCEIIEVERLNIENFKWMINNYNIIELNTSIKPFYFQYFLQRYQDVNIIIYFDPDVKIYDSLHIIEEEIKEKTILLTPHILTPIPQDGERPGMNTFLNYGLYNLGFMALRPCDESNKILDWWRNWLSTGSLDRAYDGFFVDQLPMNYAPLFFKNVGISRTLGYNFAYWNFHERKLSLKNGKYFVNETSPLVFAHFSSFKPTLPMTISKHQTRFLLEEGSLLYYFFLNYYNTLIENKFEELIQISCYYVDLRNEALLKQTKNKSLKMKIHDILRTVYFRIVR